MVGEWMYGCLPCLTWLLCMVMLRKIDEHEEEHVDDNLIHVVWVEYMTTFHLPIPSPKLSLSLGIL